MSETKKEDFQLFRFFDNSPITNRQNFLEVVINALAPEN